MIEALLAGGKSGRFFPDSGPGSKLLIAGTKDYGYFGEVTEADMGLNSEFNRLLDQTDASFRTVGSHVNTWFKFVLKGKFLFFPKLPLAGVIPLKDLYAMRAVVDTDDPTKYSTDITTGQPLYTQNLHIANPEKDLFKVRLFDVYPDVSQTTHTTSSVTPAVNSEIAMLFMALMTSSPHPDTLKIKKYSASEFGMINGGQYAHFFTQEIGPTSSNQQSGFVSSNLITYWYHYSTAYAWRPVLQYLPGSERAGILFNPDNLLVSNEGLPMQTVPSGEATTDLVSLTHFSNIVETQQVAVSGQADELYVIAPLGGFATSDNEYQGFAATSDQDQYLYDIDAGTGDEYSGYTSVS